MEKQEVSLELRKYLQIILKYRWLIILGTLSFLLLVTVGTVYMTPVYEASTTLLVSQRQILVQGGVSPAGESYQAVLLSEKLTKTYSEMLTGREMAARVVKKLSLKEAPLALTKRIRAEPVRDTQLIKVRVEDTDPARAQKIANTIGSIFAKEVAKLEKVNLGKGLGYRPLIAINIVEPAVKPNRPIRPKPLLNAILAIVFGLCVSTAYAFLKEYMDISIKTPEDIEQLLGLPTLGQIPTVDKNNSLVVTGQPRSAAAEAFRSFRTNIQYLNYDKNLRTLLITSAGSREGKTTIAGNVAASLADLGAKVVLISADLRRPNVHRIFEQEQEPGLSNFLIGEADLESVLRPTKFGQLKVVPSGSIPPNPAELISSARMKALIRKIKEEADYVIVDTAPVLAVSDATILASSVDGVLLVAMAGQTSREALKHSKEALEKVNARVLGAVLNRIDRTYEYGYGYYKYGYGYGYGYYYLDGEKSSRRSYRWVKLLLGLGIIILLIILVQSARFI